MAGRSQIVYAYTASYRTAEAFTQRGIGVRVGTGVVRLERTAVRVTAHYRSGEQQSQLPIPVAGRLELLPRR